jgi:hypothetical protein
MRARDLVARGRNARFGRAVRIGGDDQFRLTMNGLSGGEARPGSHASISVTPPGGVTFTSQSWGITTFGNTTYGTGANPTNFTASDGLALFWQGVGDDGNTYRAVAPIRYAPGSFGALTNQSFEQNSAVQTYTFAAATGTGLTWTYTLVSPPAFVTIDSATRTISFDTNSLALQAGTVITVRATDQYGRSPADQTFTLEITEAGVGPNTFDSTTTTFDATTLTFDEAG